MPRPPDIPFDHVAAAVAVAALDQAAAVLADVADGRSATGAVAREHFRGVYADDFDRSDRALGDASSDARSALAAVRRAVTAAAEAALRAQIVRADDQRAWDDAHAHPPPVGVR